MAMGYPKMGKDDRRRVSRGFTLPELLVALTIFLAVMGGIGILFVESMGLMRQGFQNQEAFELARSTLKIIENDLSRAFTSREHGDFYHLYGTPIGFTFVGLVSSREGAAPNLARVTYVIYHNPDPNSREGWVTTIDEHIKQTYKLLRYYEPNVDNLNDFPVEWHSYRLLSPDLEAPNSTTLGGIIDEICQCDSRYPVELDPLTATVVNAKKRELWIRMLSGGDESVPSAWNDDQNVNNGIRPQREIVGAIGIPWVDLGATFNTGVTAPEDVLDYVIAENILYTAFDGVNLTNNLFDDDLDGMVDESMFNNFDDNGDGVDDDVGEIAETDIAYRPDLGQGYYPAIVSGEASTIVRTDLIDREPLYFFTYIDLVTELIEDPFDSRRQVIVPITMRYWNDLRNIELEIPNDAIDNDGDGFIDEVPDTTAGSPLYPRLPQEVTTNFEIFFESPYPNTPDFRKIFAQNIDIPAGYRRYNSF